MTTEPTTSSGDSASSSTAGRARNGGMESTSPDQSKKALEESIKITVNPEMTLEGWQVSELMQQNKILKNGLNCQNLLIEAMYRGSAEIKMKSWSTKEDMAKAEAILFTTLRSVLVPKPL